MSAPTRNTPYKKYQCRYFDEKGRPLKPSCNQGPSCCFVHPDDPNWPGVKCLSQSVLRNKDSGSRSSRTKDKYRHPVSPPNLRSPLVSQRDWFARCKIESEEEDFSLNYSQSSRKNGTTLPNRHHAVSEDGQAAEINRRGRSLARYQRSPVSPSRDLAHKNKDGTRTTNVNLGESQTNVGQPVAPVSEAEIFVRSERYIAMFTDVARVSSQIIQDTVLLDQEERKLRTFNEISETLAKISTSSAGAVAGPVADVILAHTQSKERLDENFRLLGAAWEKVFDSLMVEFNMSLENRLQAALASVKNEAEIAMSDIIAGTNQLKRRIDRMSMSPEPDSSLRSKGEGTKENESSGSSGSIHSSIRNLKRRKIAGSSRSCSPASDHHRQRGEPNLRNTVVKISLEDILHQMKMKIDQQSTSLRLLSQENEELKSQLQPSPPRVPKSHLSELSMVESDGTGSLTNGQKSFPQDPSKFN